MGAGRLEVSRSPSKLERLVPVVNLRSPTYFVELYAIAGTGDATLVYCTVVTISTPLGLQKKNKKSLIDRAKS